MPPNDKDKQTSKAFWKWLSLAVFMVQNSWNPIIFRWATTELAADERYSTSVCLFIQELLKLVMSFALIVAEEAFSPGRAARIFHEEVLQKPRDTLALAIPAVLFACTNALLQLSSGNLPAAVWQVTYQGKLLVTAAFSVVLLKKEFTRAQWLAIGLLALGIAIVQLSGADESKKTSMGNAAEQNYVMGMVMLAASAVCASFAAVYFEKIVKQGGATASATKKASVWVQNMQLAGFSLLIAASGIFTEVMLQPKSETHHFVMFRGFSAKVCLMAFNNAFGGLLVALVIKHADNILRAFSSALATIACSFMSVIIFGFDLRVAFGIGTAVVLGSTLLYGGILKMPGPWWNSVPALAVLRSSEHNRAELDCEKGGCKSGSHNAPTGAQQELPQIARV